MEQSKDFEDQPPDSNDSMDNVSDEDVEDKLIDKKTPAISSVFTFKKGVK